MVQRRAWFKEGILAYIRRFSVKHFMVGRLSFLRYCISIAGLTSDISAPDTESAAIIDYYVVFINTQL